MPKHLPKHIPTPIWSIRTVGCCLVSMCISQFAARAATPGGVARLAEQEAARRQQRLSNAGDELQRADTLLIAGKTQEALEIFEGTLQSIPETPLTHELRLAALSGYINAGCTHAQELMVEGKRTEAEALIGKLLAAAPGDKRVIESKKRFADPDRYPPALTAEHVERVRKVRETLIKADSFLEIGDYDNANRTYQDVLRIDPFNSAARRGMERVERARSAYFKAATDQQRAKMLAKVDQTWEDPVPLTSADVSALFGATMLGQSNAATGREIIQDKLRSYRMPKVEFVSATINEVIELLRIRSRDLDPQGKGIDFVVNVDEVASQKPISLTLTDTPMDEVIRYITEMAGVAYRVENFAVQITSLGEKNSAIITRSFRVPPDFIQNGPAAPAGGPVPDPFAPGAVGAGGGLSIRRMGAKEFLESRGVTFPEGSSASFNPAGSTLTVRNSVANMETVELLVELASKSAPKMATITVRMLEVNQENLDELGFDWLLGGAGVQGQGLFVGGGSTGSGNAFSATDYPFGGNSVIPAQTSNGLTVFPAQPVASAVGGSVPLGAAVQSPGGGGGPLSSGLRSGTYATDLNAIDALLQTGSAQGQRSIAPGVLSVAGVFTDPQFQTVLRGLAQKKGIDINASPSVTTKSGVKAISEITREFIYPTEFDPPQLPQGGGGQMIATPTTPTAFEMRKTGVIMEVEPVISEDGQSVELTIIPELTDFEGFVNYGSPILSPASSAFQPVLSTVLLAAAVAANAGPPATGGTPAVTGVTTSYIPLVQAERLITPNLILQPIFKTQKVSTAVKVWDGSTIMLGGAKIQRHTTVDDRIPILGNLPFIGRLFQSIVTKKDTKNIIIFVTVNVIDPSGQKIKKQTASLDP